MSPEAAVGQQFLEVPLGKFKLALYMPESYLLLPWRPILRIQPKPLSHSTQTSSPSDVKLSSCGPTPVHLIHLCDLLIICHLEMVTFARFHSGRGWIVHSKGDP